ncbi:hypothetical protein [Flagellimonas crocea]|uniref:hypothetical protein n=1 Tax=Flagellimonas crocea TaxID=3067311 RepID=UPI00296F5835|nr:hypothetical protein [Muricauda sp. DH64]
MKKLLPIAILILAQCLVSCESDNLEHYDEFIVSLRAWENFKESAKNSYRYTVNQGSWVGFSSKTTITVESGTITERSFQFTNTGGISSEIPEDELEWTETADEIGFHANGAAPLTMDEVYDKAKNDWLRNRTDATPYFETMDNGLISTCGYVEKGCIDDCFVGIHIESIDPL